MMAKVEKIVNLGEKVEGIMLRPQQVSVMGLVDQTAGYAVGIRVISDAGEALTIMMPVEFMPMFIRLQQEKTDEMQAMLAAPRT